MTTTCSFAVSLGFGGAAASDLVDSQVLRIWANGILIYDATTLTGWNTAAGIKFKLYKGTENQVADPVLVDWLGEDFAIAFRGQIVLFFYDFPLSLYGFSTLPIIRAEIRDTYRELAKVLDFTRLTTATGGPGDPSDSVPLAVDWPLQRMYAWSSSGTILHTYDITSNLEIMSVTPTSVYQNAFSAAFSDPYYGYVIYNAGGIANSLPIVAVDPFSGLTVGTFGSSNAGLNNLDSGFVTARDFGCMRIDGVNCVQPFIVQIGFQGNLGVMTLASDGTLAYAWHDGQVIYTVNDILPALAAPLFTTIEGDLITDGTNSATAFVASHGEIIRVCLTFAPTTTGGQTHWLGRTDKIWTAPSNNDIGWIFIDKSCDDIICIHRDTINSEAFFSRIQLTPNIKGLSVPLLTGGGGLGNTLNATSLWTCGPIPGPQNPGSTGSWPPTAANLHSGWDKSTIGSTHTLGYQNSAGANEQFVLLDCADGTFFNFLFSDYEVITTTGGITSGSGAIDLHENHLWNGDSQNIIGFSNTGATIPFGPAKIAPIIPADGGIPIGTILGWLMEYANFDAEDISIDAGLTDEYTGALVAEVGLDVWNMMDDMKKVFRFNLFESEGSVKFTKVNRDAQLTIAVTLDTTNDLLSIQASDNEGKGSLGGAGSETPGQASANEAFTMERDWTQDVPSSVELHYLDETQEYTVNIARASKTSFPVSTTTNDNTERVDVPIIMTPAEAIALAAKVLYDAYTGQVFHEIRLGPKYIRLEPGDVIALTINGQDYVLSITEGTMNADWSMSIRAQSFANIDELDLVGENVINDNQSVVGPSISQGFIIDTPPILPADAQFNDPLLRFYTEITSYGQSGWIGGDILLGGAAAGPFSNVWEDTLTGAVLGIATSALSGGLASTTDFISNLAVTITVTGDTIDSAGYLLVGKTGRWELMSYESAVASTGNARQYTFSTLTRGLRGTEWWMGQHVAGDFVLVYDPTHTGLITTATGFTTLYYRACGINLDPTLVASRSFALANNFEKPWAPTSLKATTISGGSSGITLSWMRRTRLLTKLGDGVTGGAPLEPGWTENYEIDILSGPSGSVLRTVTGVTTNSYTYASGNVTTDFGSRPATISFNVYQTSPVVGRGFAGSITTDVVSVT